MITVSWNSAAPILDTVVSVLAQTSVEVEYLFFDGASNDETVKKIKPYRENIATLVSEPDHGIYDAMNKGIELAFGSVVAFLNSDDVYVDTQTLAKVAAHFQENRADCVDRNLHYVLRDLSRVIRNWRSGNYRRGRFRRVWHQL